MRPWAGCTRGGTSSTVIAHVTMLAIVPSCSGVGRSIPAGLRQPIRGGRFLLALSSASWESLTRRALSSAIPNPYTGAHSSRKERYSESYAGEVGRPGMVIAGPLAEVRTPPCHASLTRLGSALDRTSAHLRDEHLGRAARRKRPSMCPRRRINIRGATLILDGRRYAPLLSTRCSGGV